MTDEAAGEPSGVTSVHTGNLPELFERLDISLLVTTYQAGRVILVRRGDDEAGQPTINTHFREFDKPMGACLQGQRLAIGGTQAIWQFRNVPALASRLEPPGTYDACYVPVSVRFTGNVDIHEMSFAADGELWLVNTRFSCLCTTDEMHSFNPRWRPSFVSALSPEDRCHLNGLAMRDGRPRYVTALGEADTRAGWRPNKTAGGVVVDVERDEVLVRGLAMPHSPRWHDGRLWVLESGRGALGVVDPQSGVLSTVATVPGFARGLDFRGPLAFVGLSQVREGAIFSGLPITRELTQRYCGVWVVHTGTGETVAFLRFESGVEEIFAVQVLPGVRHPELLPADAPVLEETYVVPNHVLDQVELPDVAQEERSPHGLMARALALRREGAPGQAVDILRQCLALQPDHPDARFALAVTLAESGNPEEALAHLQHVVDREPDRVDVQLSLGSLYQRLGSMAEARVAFQTALARAPDDPAVHVAYAVLLLQMGKYTEGFKEFEWRLRSQADPLAGLPQPQWDGRPAADQVLLIYLEHDDPRRLILLLRLIPLASARAARVLVSCPDEFAALLAGVEGVDEVRAWGSVPARAFDVRIPLDSLPHALGIDDVPAVEGCIDLVTLARRRAAQPVSEPQGRWRVGIARSDGHRPSHGARGAVPEALLRELAAAPDVELVDLDEPSGDRATTDLADLAQLIDRLDLVLGVDCAAIHLAGALGRAAWVFLGTPCEWYWPASGSRTPWYPSARLVREGEQAPRISDLLGAGLHS